MDRRPILVAVAGPNGAGKTTFFQSHLASAALRYVSADVLAAELNLDAYAAARAAEAVRRQLLRLRESFAFETVFSDPVGAKLDFLKEAVAAGYTVALFFIGLAGPDLSEERVAMRVLKGGHDVPTDKIKSRYPRTLKNLADAIKSLPIVYVLDNSDISRPFRLIARFENGKPEGPFRKPDWLKGVL